MFWACAARVAFRRVELGFPRHRRRPGACSPEGIAPSSSPGLGIFPVHPEDVPQARDGSGVVPVQLARASVAHSAELCDQVLDALQLLAVPWCGRSSKRPPDRWCCTVRPARTAPGWRSRCCWRLRASRAHVVADYALSEDALGITAVLAGHPGPPKARAYAEEHWRTRPATMASALRHLDATYGGVVGYLRGACGLTDDEIAMVRDRLTRPAHMSRR